MRLKSIFIKVSSRQFFLLIKKNNTILLFMLLLLIASCGSEPEPTENNVPEGIDGKTMLTQQQMELAGFEFGSIEKVLLSGDVNARGVLALPPESHALISPLTGGVVTSIEVTLGQIVSKGQPLCYLTHPNLINLQQEYLINEQQLRFLENEYERQRKLYDEKVSSEKKFLQTQTDFETAKGRSRAMSIILAQMGLDAKTITADNMYSRVPVVSPIRGIVNDIMASIGKNVSENELLFEVSCRKKLLVELEVFEKDIMKIQEGQRVSFNLSNIDATEHEAVVISRGASVQQAGRVVLVRASFENSNESLLPGMFVASKIHTGEELFDALPEGAIMNSSSVNPYIFYTTTPEGSEQMFFDRAAITTGYAEDGFVSVKLAKPLPAGARVVTTGGYYINARQLQSAE
ncbi:MAG TPA: efflux RND transporter periplasmic adaptor subunit [Bacteroidales bacterium]|nr:efflux RND transporter periplasmic adaptor subunit [Bacteroidales bacterium]